MPFKNPDDRRKANTEVHRRAKAAARAFLGDVCCMCGFSDKRALQIDHKIALANTGKKRLSPYTEARRVLAHPEEYQLLCANCHAIKTKEDLNYGH